MDVLLTFFGIFFVGYSIVFTASVVRDFRAGTRFLDFMASERAQRLDGAAVNVPYAYPGTNPGTDGDGNSHFVPGPIRAGGRLSRTSAIYGPNHRSGVVRPLPRRSAHLADAPSVGVPNDGI